MKLRPLLIVAAAATGLGVVALLLGTLAKSPLDSAHPSSKTTTPDQESSVGDRPARPAPSNAPATPREPQRVLAAPGARASPSEEAKLVFLDSRTRDVPAGSRWEFVTGNKSLPGTVRADGSCSIEPGTWTVRSVDGGLHPTPSQLELLPGESRVVWVSTGSTIAVRAADSSGRPISGARVRWKGRQGFSSPYELSSALLEDPCALEALTGGDGRASLVTEGSEGELLILADGFSRRRLSLAARPSQELVVTLARGPAARSLQILDERSNEAVVGARVVGEVGLVATSDADGTLSLPSWVARDSPLRIAAPEYVECLVTPSELESSQVFLQGGTGLTLMLSGASADDVQILLDADDSGYRGSGRAFLPSMIDRIVDGEASLIVPEQSQCHVSAVGPLGQSASASFLATGERRQVTLYLSTEDGLVLRFSPGATGTALVQYDWTAPQRLTLVDGEMHVAMPSRVRRMAVFQRGAAARYFYPHPDRTRSKEGTLEVVPQAPAVLSLTLQHSDGEPAVGYSVEVRRNTESVWRYPELHGGWPTAHPGWIERPGPSIVMTTDAGGLAKFVSLHPGDYEVVIDVPFLYRPDGEDWDLFEHPPFGLSLGEKGLERTVIVPSMRRISLEVFGDGAPLGSFGVLVGDQELAVDGNYWQGWIADTISTLPVVGAGYETQHVSVSGQEHYRIELASQ